MGIKVYPSPLPLGFACVPPFSQETRYFFAFVSRKISREILLGKGCSFEKPVVVYSRDSGFPPEIRSSGDGERALWVPPQGLRGGGRGSVACTVTSSQVFSGTEGRGAAGAAVCWLPHVLKMIPCQYFELYMFLYRKWVMPCLINMWPWNHVWMSHINHNSF